MPGPPGMGGVFIGLGSNAGKRLANLRQAVEALEAAGMEVVAVSSVYETDPVGPPQPAFLNAVCEVRTSLPPADLLRALKGIEQGLGRRPGERWGPREIDLDLLLYGGEILAGEELTLPHPELTRRAFVLVPLLEIAPGLELPTGGPAAAFLECEPRGVRRLDMPLRAGG